MCLDHTRPIAFLHFIERCLACYQHRVNSDVGNNHGRIVRRITGWLLAAVAVLLVMHIVRLNTPRDLSFTTLRMVIDKFHLDREANVPTWFSSAMMLGAAALMIWIGLRARREGARLGRRWIVLGAIFVLMSMDEVASFHEMLIHPVRERLGLEHICIFHFAWVVPAMAVLAVLAVAYLTFFLALPARTRWGLLGAAAIFISGAIGMEMVGGTLAARDLRESTAFAVTVTIEETLELLGMVLLLHTLMMHAFVREQSPLARDLAPAVRRIPPGRAVTA
jgi:hypothetical protein